MGNTELLTRLQQLLGSLAEISTSVQGTQQLLQRVVTETMQFTGAAGAVVERLVGDDVEYLSAAGSIAAHVGLRMPLQGSLSGLAVQTREIQRCDDSETDPRVNREACRRVHARSMLIVPLLFHDEVIGVLKAASDQPAAFGEGEEQALKLSAGIIGAVIGRQSQLEVREREGAALQAASERHRQASLTDALTGLPNRRAFETQLGEELQQPDLAPGRMALLFLDMNGFKAINDDLGHHVGDLALCKVGEIMVASLRNCDTVSRLAGDEFVALVRGLDGGQPQLEWLCQKLLAAFAQPQALSAGLSLTLSVAIGAAMHDDLSLTRSDWLKRADAAMYAAKRQEGAACVVYGQERRSSNAGAA
jgi:diguanylate cyclase (GGDEF)-like protein